VVSRSVVNYNKLKWALFSFQPYKSPGMDGIMPIMLQQVFELLADKLLMLLRASLALGYIPVSWGHTRVVFISNPGKSRKTCVEVTGRRAFRILTSSQQSGI
jgi:hypothetical protein